MEFSWTIACVALAINWGWMLLMLWAQGIDEDLNIILPRHSIIPGTKQKFLYFQDFWTMTWGDGIGVGLIFVAFAHLAYYYFGLWHKLAFVAAVLLLGVMFAKMCLGKDHKPDMGFPSAGKISLIGVLHLPYFGAGIAAAVSCLWLFFMPGIVLAYYSAGAVFYAVCFLLEIRSGNFDPLKLEEQETYGHDFACGHGSAKDMIEIEL